MPGQKNNQQSLWWNAGKNCLSAIDQRLLPHQLVVADIHSLQEAAAAIRNMTVRGAPLIGVTAAYAFYLAARGTSAASFRTELQRAYTSLLATRPTAVNLKWALDEMMTTIAGESHPEEACKKLFDRAEKIKNDDIEMCRRIGEHGLRLIETVYEEKCRLRPDARVNILTHCNAGRLACVEWGTATSPIYQAHRKGIPLHVWVDETRPCNQGAALTAWELEQEKIPYTLIADNTGGLLMRQGKVDMALVGADRVTASGDVANKIGTYLKALAAKDNQVPFYVAFPSSTLDRLLHSGEEIAIEQRAGEEVKYVQGRYKGEIISVLIAPEEAKAANYGFDITPARLVSGYITEAGIFSSPAALQA